MNINAKSHKYKLSNGLTVLLLESHKSPVVSVQMWVKTGSADEKKGEEGISHFIEHLVFKGTRKFGVGEIAATVEGSGGELNAYTSFDQTVFYVTISKSFVETGLEVISEMMGFPAFDSQEIDNEREVVIEEIKRGNDSLGRRASQLLFSANFKRHPYGIPVIGYDRVIRKVSRKTLVNYYQSRYVPKNMFLVVAGDFTQPEMKKLVAKYYGGIPQHKLRKVKRLKEPKQSKQIVKVEKAPFEETQFHISWKIPGLKHKDIPALDVLAFVLGQGESSRLSQRLRVQQALVNHVYASSFTPEEQGLFAVAAGLNAENLALVLEGIQQSVMQMLLEAPAPEELHKAVTNLQSEEYYAMETVDGLARKIGSLEMLTGDLNYFDKYIKRVKTLKPVDISRVARKYLDPSRMTFSMVCPEKADQIKKIVASWSKGFVKSYKLAKRAQLKASKTKKTKVLAKPWRQKPQGEGSIVEHALPSGGRLILRPSFETPVVSVRMGLLGGLRVEPRGQEGLTELLSRCWTGGTQNLSESQIQQKMDSLASGMGAFGGRNTIGMNLDSLAPFAREAGEILSDIVNYSTLPDEVIEREKVLMLENLKTREDNPSQVASQLFIENLFKGHPYARDINGTPDSVKALSRAQLAEHLRRMLTRQNLTAVVAGAADIEYWKDLFAQVSEKLPPGERLDQKFEHREPNQDVQLFKHLDKHQTHIIYGFKGLTFQDSERYALQLMQSILAGQGGRLFIELRDKASLAYTVAPLRMEGIDTGYFGAYIGCSPEKGAKAISMMKDEFEKLAENTVAKDELDRAKRYLIGRHDIDLQKNSTIASGILFDDIYKTDYRELFQFAQRVNMVSAEDVQRLAKKIFGQKSVLVAVGAVEPWNN